MRRFTKSEYIQNGRIISERKSLNGEVSEHWHDFFEIEYILSGSGIYAIDGKEYEIRGGLLFFMTPLNFHRVHMNCSELYNVMFSGDICAFSSLSALAEISPVAIETDKADRPFYTSVFEELAKNSDNAELAAALLNAVTAKLASDTAGLVHKGGMLPVKQAELYILNNFRNRLTLESTAKKVGLSPSYLSHIFKKETGTNFKAYLNSVRYSYAEKLLAFSDMTAAEICAECGFEDYPNFLRRFKQKNGVYPIEYRSRTKNGNLCYPTD